MRLSRERLALVFVLAGLAGVTVVASADAATPSTAPSVAPTASAVPRPAPSQIKIDPKLPKLSVPAVPAPPPVPVIPSWKPANGKLLSLSVPGGSFAEDEAQKIQASGSGGCSFDLTLSNKSYGGSTENTWSVGPLKIEPASTMYNGTHFGTLAEGSWSAKAVGTKGCTGTATIDFKVTAKTSTKKVMGKPVVAFDKAPQSGGTTFSKSKDSNIWFKVSVPQSIKDEPNATCCELELNYKNEYGGWEVLPNSPFSDPSYKGALTGQNGVSFRSVSYFTDGREWRVRMRGAKYKTEFEWSDWLEFGVDQL